MVLQINNIKSWNVKLTDKAVIMESESFFLANMETACSIRLQAKKLKLNIKRI